MIHFGRDTTGNLDIAETKEWLVTNGKGGYASGTIAGSLLRGYHGLLVASLHAPIDRRLMLVKLEETLTVRNQSFSLTSNRWDGGSISPNGFVNLQSFELEGSIPRWTYACADVMLRKRIWMEAGENTTYVEYEHFVGNEKIKLSISAIADNRVFHNTGQVSRPVDVESIENGIKVTSNDGSAKPLTLLMEGAEVHTANELYSNFYLPAEAYRGLYPLDKHVHAGDFYIELSPGDRVVFGGSAEDDFTINHDSLQQRTDYDNKLIRDWEKTSLPKKKKFEVPDWVHQSVLAADQFVVSRETNDGSEGKSVIAGYHWFEDWGRDTMISLPGLTLPTGRPKDAKLILKTFAEYVNEGMLPNRFPDQSDHPQYNTIDATLWYFQAIRSYYEQTKDLTLLKDLFHKLEIIIEYHLDGTRYNIKVDPNDNLLAGGEEGVQLTWMDALVNGKVITPRIGKPIEVNALWYNALRAMVLFAKALGKSEEPYETLSQKTKEGFQRFWNDEKQYCYDVLDGPNGDEDLLRPNQVIAISLPEIPLSEEQQKKIVEVSQQYLVTSHGLRSLAPFESEYVGVYGGDQFHRDSSYHQGTVWGWLIGPFIKAHVNVYQNKEEAILLLSSLADHLSAAGLGSVSEIFDGDAPFTPRGCIAQAWSVAQLLEAYQYIINSKS